MNRGKLSQAQTDRSIYKTYRNKKRDDVVPAKLGTDYSVYKGFHRLVAAKGNFMINTRDAHIIAANKAYNNLLCSMADPVSMTIDILLPAKFAELHIKNYMKDFGTFASNNGFEIVDGHTELSPVINSPVFCVTAYGSISDDIYPDCRRIKPGLDIVMTKYTGYLGSMLMSRDKKEELTTRYSKSYIENASRLFTNIGNSKEIDALRDIKEHIYAIHDVSTGGVYAALWDMCIESHSGIDIDLRSIPIKQETVEMSEFYNINPYMMDGTGSAIIITDNGDLVVETLESNGLFGTIIGCTNDTNDRIIKLDDEIRYLVPPKGCELHKIY